MRIALGAQQRDVFRMVIEQGFGLTLTGIAIGLAGALPLARVLGSLLYVAILASYIPAGRAIRADPMVALRYE